MPTRIYHPLLFWIAKSANRNVAHALELLKAENEMLRSRLPKQIRTTPQERHRLMKLAKPLGSTVRSVLTIVSYTTLLRWQRDRDRKPGAETPKVGRPKTSDEVRDLVLRLAHENAWGYNRILGELKKLGIFVSRTTVKNILVAHGCEPSPDRSSDSWENFLKRHASTLWACDFISKKIWTKSGFVDCFMLFYIHLSTRRVHLGGVSVDPNASWLMQQARNAAMVFEDQPDKPIILIHDRDGKFTPRFDEILESSGVEIKKLPPYAPNLNSVAERWVQSCRREALDHFVVFGEAHMRHIAENYVKWYNTFRPHQSLENKPLTESQAPPPADSVPRNAEPIACQSWLGGLLKHYYRKAA